MPRVQAFEDPKTKILATLQTITQPGALDRAAARKMEEEGPSMLNTVMLATATEPLRQTLQICASAPGPVIFHCQKGKDRTGMVAMLLQSCGSNGDVDDQALVDEYAKSGTLLGEDLNEPAREEEKRGLLDFSKFRGSPPSAMSDTLAWIRERYGSVQGYVKIALSVDSTTLEKLKAKRVVKES